MKKLSMLSALVLGLVFVPSVKAAEKPALDETYRDTFFANGYAITIDKKDGDEEGTTGAKICWQGEEEEECLEVDADVTVFGGSHNDSTELPTSKITMRGGTIHGIFGGGMHTSYVKNATIEMTGGKVDFIMGGGTAGFITDCEDRDDTKRNPASAKDGSTLTKVDIATVIVSGGEITGSVFGGGEDYSYTGRSSVTIAESFTGNINYVTGGGSNGYTNSTSVEIDGGTVNVLQAVNRGFAGTSTLVVNGGHVKKAFASAEGDNENLGVEGTAVLTVNEGAEVDEVAPGQNGASGNDKKGAILNYHEGTLTAEKINGFATEDTTVTIALKIVVGDKEHTFEYPKGALTSDDVKAEIRLYNLLNEDSKIEGFYIDEKFEEEISDFSKLEDGSVIYVKTAKIETVTPPNTGDINLVLIISAIIAAVAGTIFAKKKIAAKAN